MFCLHVYASSLSFCICYLFALNDVVAAALQMVEKKRNFHMNKLSMHNALERRARDASRVAFKLM